MSLIDNTYFINDINIPGNILTIDSFTPTINRYEPEILEDLLGYELYKALLADLDGSGLPQTQRFKDLIEGAEFSFDVCGETVNTKWEGLKNSNKESLISYYVYYQYRSQTDTFYAASGAQAQPLLENSSIVDVAPKIVNAWNKMLRLYGSLDCDCYFIDRKFNNKGYNYSTWRDLTTYEHYNDKASAYNFLLANVSSYPEWVFKPKYKMNQFGI